jgi:hypothetical protein
MNGSDELIFLGLAVDQVGDVNGNDIPDIVVAAAGAPPFHAPSAVVSGSDGSTHSRLHDLTLAQLGLGSPSYGAGSNTSSFASPGSRSAQREKLTMNFLCVTKYLL